jgi:hypothetical protein
LPTVQAAFFCGAFDKSRADKTKASSVESFGEALQDYRWRHPAEIEKSNVRI